MKIKFTGWIELDEMPDDRGSIDNWLGRAIDEAVVRGSESEDGLEALEILHIEWELEA